MAAGRYLKQGANNTPLNVAAAVVATANAIVGTNAAGTIDVSFLPTGVGPEIITATATETIAAGAFVNIFNNSGVISVRNADATTNAKPAHGFVLSAYVTTNVATIYISGQINTGQTGLTLGAEYFLSTTPGAIVPAATAAGYTTTGNILQRVGVADKTSEIVFSPYLPIEQG